MQLCCVSLFKRTIQSESRICKKLVELQSYKTLNQLTLPLSTFLTLKIISFQTTQLHINVKQFWCRDRKANPFSENCVGARIVIPQTKWLWGLTSTNCVCGARQTEQVAQHERRTIYSPKIQTKIIVQKWCPFLSVEGLKKVSESTRSSRLDVSPCKDGI